MKALNEKCRMGLAILAFAVSLYPAAHAAQLPAPGNLRASGFTSTSLSLEADAVDGASGYRFEVSRLEGTPETVAREDFASAPELSAAGWSLASSNTSLSNYTASGYYDVSADDRCALKIDRKSSSGDVSVEVLTPVFPAAVRECSFVCRVGAAGKSDVFRVLGRSDGSSAWSLLAEVVPADKSRTNATVAVGAAAGIVQAKFVFAASATNFSIAAWDSLRVVYGGDETRTAVADAAAVQAEPRLSLSDLACGRYAFRAQAVGGGDYSDSPWCAEQVVDLAWAGIVVGRPTNVAAVQSGAALDVSWDAAANAERYRVTVASADDPAAVPAVAETEHTYATVAVPSIGSYLVSVTALSPGGVSQETSDVCTATVALGRVGAVAAEATDVSEVTATWGAVPLAEGYLASIYRLVDGGGRVTAGAASVAGCSATFGGLDPSATYVVEVVPQPGGDASLGAQSEPVDMSAAKFRKTGAAPLPRDEWTERFDALAGMRSDTEVRRVPLDYWQFAKGTAEPEELLYTTTSTRTTGGVYVFSDAAHTTNSFALGSLASGSYGCAFGIALVNAGRLEVDRDMELSFDMVQRSYKANRSAYVLEWKVTDGETGILSEGGWTAVEIPASAPWAAGDENCPSAEYRQTATARLSLPARLAPGGVLILRWSHPKVASGPMMAIDNVRLAFRRLQRALRITLW